MINYKLPEAKSFDILSQKLLASKREMRRKLFYLLKYLFIKNILCQEDYVEPECYDDLTLGTFIIRFLKISSEQIVKCECFQALQTELFRFEIYSVG